MAGSNKQEKEKRAQADAYKDRIERTGAREKRHSQVYCAEYDSDNGEMSAEKLCESTGRGRGMI